jgi:hypothetical protein
MIPELRALPSSVLLSSSAGGGNLTPHNGSLDIRHHRGPLSMGMRAISTAICLYRRCRRPRVHARLRAEERTRSWLYNVVDWPITSNWHADWHAGSNMNGEMLTCGTAMGSEWGSHSKIWFGLHSFRLGPLKNWLSTFSNIFYYKQQKYLWACGKELGNHKQNILLKVKCARSKGDPIRCVQHLLQSDA